MNRSGGPRKENRLKRFSGRMRREGFGSLALAARGKEGDAQRTWKGREKLGAERRLVVMNAPGSSRVMA